MQSVFSHFANTDFLSEDVIKNTNESNLVETVVIPNFITDIEEISKDRVVNVRIMLGEMFMDIQENYHSLFLVDDKKLQIWKKEKLNNIKTKLLHYLNRYFYKTLKNLQEDKDETVRESVRLVKLANDDGLDFTEAQSQGEQIEIPQNNQVQGRMRESPQNRTMSHDLFGEAPADDLTRLLSGTSDLLNFESLDSQLQIEDRISDLVLGQDDQNNSIEPKDQKSEKQVFEYQEQPEESKE